MQPADAGGSNTFSLRKGSLLLTKGKGWTCLNLAGRSADLIPKTHRTPLQRVGARHAHQQAGCAWLRSRFAPLQGEP